MNSETVIWGKLQWLSSPWPIFKRAICSGGWDWIEITLSHLVSKIHVYYTCMRKSEYSAVTKKKRLHNRSSFKRAICSGGWDWIEITLSHLVSKIHVYYTCMRKSEYSAVTKKKRLHNRSSFKRAICSGGWDWIEITLSHLVSKIHVYYTCMRKSEYSAVTKKRGYTIGLLTQIGNENCNWISERRKNTRYSSFLLGTLRKWCR